MLPAGVGAELASCQPREDLLGSGLEMTPRERVLVVENEDGAGPEMFGQWLSGAGVKVDLWRPYRGETMPEATTGAVMVLGGEMSAWDDHGSPWLGQVRTLLAEATAKGQAVLGICLGAQMLAVACGGRVEESQHGGELGLARIELTAEARRDRLFGAIASPAEAVVWHNDEVVQLPEGAVLLGSSPACKVQAFRIGDRAWGVQFHPEVTTAALEAWAAADGSQRPGRQARLQLVIAEVAAAEARFLACWQGFAERFADIVLQN